jgi:hypothetical protein
MVASPLTEKILPTGSLAKRTPAVNKTNAIVKVAFVINTDSITQW